MEKVIQLAKKLKALADRGIGGEKQNAETMLKALMEKHSITMDMIDENNLAEHTFELEDKDRKFWKQVVASVIGTSYELFTYPYDRRHHRKVKRYTIKCTPSDYIEIQAKYDFFTKAYEDELEIFYSAFIQKNKLYAKSKGDDNKDQPDMTPEEMDKLYRMLEMMKGMKNHRFLKQIENNK